MSRVRQCFLQSSSQSRGLCQLLTRRSTVRPAFRATNLRLHTHWNNCNVYLESYTNSSTSSIKDSHTHHVRPSLHGLAPFRTTGCCQPRPASVRSRDERRLSYRRPHHWRPWRSRVPRIWCLARCRRSTHERITRLRRQGHRLSSVGYHDWLRWKANLLFSLSTKPWRRRVSPVSVPRSRTSLRGVRTLELLLWAIPRQV